MINEILNQLKDSLKVANSLTDGFDEWVPPAYHYLVGRIQKLIKYIETSIMTREKNTVMNYEQELINLFTYQDKINKAKKYRKKFLARFCGSDPVCENIDDMFNNLMSKRICVMAARCLIFIDGI
jgi:hypothetical protein